MIRALVDTNVLASAAATLGRPGSKPAAILRRWRAGTFVLIVCPTILRERNDLQRRPYFSRAAVAADLARTIELLVQLAEVAPDDGPVDIAVHDPADVPIVAAARHAQADFIVTDDEDLLALPVINPADFLAVLAAERGEEAE